MPENICPAVFLGRAGLGAGRQFEYQRRQGKVAAVSDAGEAENASGKGGDCTVKKNEKLDDASGQIDERYIAEALEPMYQESVGTSDENKAAMPKKGK